MKRALKAKRANFRTVWATLQEVAAMNKESTQRLEREMKERDERFEREMKEKDERLKELDRITKENYRAIGKLGNRFGEMVEYIVVPNLKSRFHELGFEFDDPELHRHMGEEKNGTATEVDIFLENESDGYAMVVEVKSTPSTSDIDDHVERIRKIRADAELKGAGREFMGAVAGMVFYDNVKQYALKKGFYLIVPSWDNFTIIAPPLPGNSS